MLFLIYYLLLVACHIHCEAYRRHLSTPFSSPKVYSSFSFSKRISSIRSSSNVICWAKKNSNKIEAEKDKADFFVKEYSGVDYEDEEDIDSEEDDPGFEVMEGGMARTPREMNDKEWMFFDVARVNVRGGDGGDGCMAMRREYCIEFGGPSGGNGGNGGSVYLQCDKNLNTLALLRRKVHHRGKDGTNGRGDSRHGQKGDDIIVPVPPGTIVRDQFGALAGELNNHGDRMLVARGGRGGRGNEYFKTPRMNAPNFAEKGELGHERWINVELKLIADVGLVGVPNAGKSTLLASVTNAKPKIADYPFTTVVPNLGVCDLFQEESSSGASSTSLVLADIPGLLEGAHTGVGLGIAFLRHIQRCKVLIHVINGDSPDPIGDFQAINQELALFNPRLVNKTQVIVLNKIDIPAVAEKVPLLVSELKRLAGHTRILAISAATRTNVRELMIRVSKVVQSLPAQTSMELFLEENEEKVNFAAEDGDDRFTDYDGSSYQIVENNKPGIRAQSGGNDMKKTDFFDIMTDPAYPGQFRVVGKRIERIVQMTNWSYYESMLRFQRILEAQGISKALEEAGAKQGDLVMIGDLDFNYWDTKNRWIANLGLEETLFSQQKAPK